MESLIVLTSPPDLFDIAWLDPFERVSCEIGKSLTPPSNFTHVSFSSAASYEACQDEGGAASYLTEVVKAFMNRKFRDALDGIQERIDLTVTKGFFGNSFKEVYTSEPLYDCFGRIALDRNMGQFYHLYLKGEVQDYGSLLCHHPIIGELLYRGVDEKSIRKRDFSFSLRKVEPYRGEDQNEILYIPINKDLLSDVKSIDNEPYSGHLYNEILGDMVVLWAFSESLNYGSFYNDRGEVVNPINGTIALFHEPGVKVWRQNTPIPVEYMVLEEPGWKVRPLTKNPVWSNVIDQVARHALDLSIKSDERCGVGFDSAHVLWDLLKGINRKFKTSPFEWYFVNVDLTAATDRIPKPLLRAIWKGLFRGLGIGPEHPLWVYSESQLKDYEIEYRNKTYEHRCGSFMGTPLSFLGLTMYNLCIVEISSYLDGFSLPVTPKSLEKFSRVSGSLDGIVGDDLMRFTNRGNLYKKTVDLFKETNGKPSKGKYTVSSIHGILCESHVYKCGDKHPFLNFLDIIRCKLLTPSTRYHSDNRSSVIGKGSALYSQIEWYKSTNKEYKVVPEMVISAYNRILFDVLEPWVYSLIPLSGVHLPHSCGGLLFPMSWEKILEDYSSQLAVLRYLVNTEDINDYLVFSTKAHHVHGNYRRGLEIDDYSYIYLKDVEYTGRVFTAFKPEATTSMFTLAGVIKFYCEKDPEIQRSPVTGLPSIRVVLTRVFDEYGFMPMDLVLDKWDRYFSFLKAFKEGSKPIRYSFQKYLHNLRKFWDEEMDRLCMKITSKELNHGFKNLDDLSWAVALKGKTLIHKDICKDKILSSGPTLSVSLRNKDGSMNPRLHSGSGWDALAKESLMTWLGDTVIDNVTDEDQGMTGYLSRQLCLKIVDGQWRFETPQP
jgi:hypothetical protein